MCKHKLHFIFYQHPSYKILRWHVIVVEYFIYLVPIHKSLLTAYTACSTSVSNKTCDYESFRRMPQAAKNFKICYFWPDCKAIPAYGLMMSVCLSVLPSVRLSVCLSTFWLTSAFKFVLGRITQYRLDTLHGNRPWGDLLNCDLSLWPWPSLFLFKVT